MTEFPNVPAMHECPPRGKQKVFALCGDLIFPDGVEVPRLFKTDGASRPFFINWLPRFGRGFAAFIGHDYAYMTQLDGRKDADRKLMSRLDHYTIEPKDRFTKKELRLIWYGVRLFGWIPWTLNKKRPSKYFFATYNELTNH